MARRRVYLYTIYGNPADYPGRVVARRFEVSHGSTRPVDRPLYIGDSVDEARNALPRGVTRLNRDANDHPSVIESWI